MKEFITLMNQIGINDTELISAVEPYVEMISFHKNEVLYSEDSPSKYYYFLLSGVLQSYSIDEDGNEYTEGFLFKPGQVHCGYIGNATYPGVAVNASVYARALVDSVAICIPIEVFSLVPELEKELTPIFIKFCIEEYYNLWRLKNALRLHSKKKALEWFYEEYPCLIDLVPNKYIASYLGMTEVSLSRIKRDLK